MTIYINSKLKLVPLPMSIDKSSTRVNQYNTLERQIIKLNEKDGTRRRRRKKDGRKVLISENV